MLHVFFSLDISLIIHVYPYDLIAKMKSALVATLCVCFRVLCKFYIYYKWNITLHYMASFKLAKSEMI